MTADDTSISSNVGASTTMNVTAENPYVINPYYGNIFPGTAAGAKLYSTATRGVNGDKKFDLTPENAINIRTATQQAASLYGWGELVSAIPTGYQPGSFNPTDHANMLLNSDDVDLDAVIFNASITWGTPNYTTFKYPTTKTMRVIDPANDDDDKISFQRRIRSEFIQKWLVGHLDDGALKTLQLRSSEFQWVKPASVSYTHLTLPTN